MFRLEICLVVVICAVSCSAQLSSCKYWYAKVDPLVEANFHLDEKSPTNVLQGIRCLLQLKGRKAEGKFSGVTHTRVSQIFPKASVEVCALYYASFLFTQDWEHANAVALGFDDEPPNSRKAIDSAFKSYRKWLIRIEKVGLDEARRNKLDPLDGSKVSWY